MRWSKTKRWRKLICSLCLNQKNTCDTSLSQWILTSSLISERDWFGRSLWHFVTLIFYNSEFTKSILFICPIVEWFCQLPKTSPPRLVKMRALTNMLVVFTVKWQSNSHVGWLKKSRAGPIMSARPERQTLWNSLPQILFFSNCKN